MNKLCVGRSNRVGPTVGGIQRTFSGSTSIAAKNWTGSSGNWTASFVPTATGARWGLMSGSQVLQSSTLRVGGSTTTNYTANFNDFGRIQVTYYGSSSPSGTSTLTYTYTADDRQISINTIGRDYCACMLGGQQFNFCQPLYPIADIEGEVEVWSEGGTYNDTLAIGITNHNDYPVTISRVTIWIDFEGGAGASYDSDTTPGEFDNFLIPGRTGYYVFNHTFSNVSGDISTAGISVYFAGTTEYYDLSLTY